MNIQQNDIVDYLQNNGPCLSSDLRTYLVDKKGMSPTNARQKISRIAGQVQRLTTLTFKNNEKFLYLNLQKNTSKYWENLFEAIKNSNPHIYMALMSIKARGGYVRKDFFTIVSGAPYQQSKRVSAATVLNRLIESQLVSTELIAGYEYIVLNSVTGDQSVTFSSASAQFKVEEILLDAIKNWAIKFNFSSQGTLKSRSENNKPIGSVRFDLSGPSYLRPLRNQANPQKNGFWVCDIILASTLNKDSVLYFINKCNLLSPLKNIGKIFPMLVANYFPEEALYMCRREGIIAVTPTTLFGKDIAEALLELLAILEKTSNVIEKDIEKIDKIFSSLSTVEGAALNLRGALFELVTAYIAGLHAGGIVEVGKKIFTSDKKSAEIDVCINKFGYEVQVIECKGYGCEKHVTLEEVSTWLNKKIPIISTYFKNSEYGSSTKQIFEFWTTAKFSDEALHFLEERSEKTKKYTIAWKDGEEVLKFAREKNASSIVDLINTHYLKHPLGKSFK